jgi:hypothetical protein
LSARFVAEYGFSMPYSGRWYNRQEETPNEYARVFGLFLGGIPCTRAGSGPLRAVMFFGANAQFKRLPAISWHGKPWGEEQL